MTQTGPDASAVATRRGRPRWITAVDDRPVLLVVLGMLLFSIGPVLVGVSTTSGGVLSFYRLWIGAAALGIALLWRRRSHPVLTSRLGWRWAAVTGVVFGTHQLLFMLAIKATSVVDVTLMQVVAPVLVGVLARVLFGERPGAAFRAWSGLAIIGAGVVVVAGTAGPEGRPAGMALAFANVVLAAFYVVWSKRAMAHIGALPFLFGVGVAAAVTVSGYVLVAGEPVGSISGRNLTIAASIALVPGVLGHFLSTYPLSRIPANIPPVVQLAMPFISGALAWLLLDERITGLHVLGGALSIAGVVGAMSSRGGRRLRAASRSTARRERDRPDQVAA
ncbi:DMT family transporter [Cellulomonas aerilata]|uniref:Multidrug transporter n=1 Tax=Cellulomonas aerilata TaxID=515326 RepID=A0A512DCT9_9CELL|nr:DMT family transporter [Cellulomonas aerilata]GEO34294.1 multidrug transporter [Cellulomonas aerilata]